MVSLRVKLKVAVLYCFPLLAQGAVGYSDWVSLPSIEVNAPRCEGTAELNAAGDYFVEIANPVAGKEEYNELVRLYETKNWALFDEKLEIFKKAFETSPLREAVSFLETEAMLIQAEGGDDAAIRNAEKKTREVLLLFPKSKLNPVLVVSAANLALANKNYTKALALFESGRVDYPFHELNCRFLLGVAETQFHLRDERASKGAFQSVLQKCSDPISKLIADVRIADIEFSTNNKKSLAIYAFYAEKFPIRLAKLAPWALFNAGESKYRGKELASAKYFFSEFIKYGKKTECSSWAMKRIADIQVKQARPVEEGVGAHYAVYDKFPNSDLGRFSRLHGFLIELEKIPSAEADRRLKLFDSEVDKIIDEELRTTLFLEKGLALLALKEKAALNYLDRFRKQKEGVITDKVTANYIREKILSLLESELKDRAKKVANGKNEVDSKLFEPLEDAYSIWFKGSSHEKRARALYQKLILSRMKQLLEQDNLGEAVARLDRWANSGIWPKEGPPKEAQHIVASALLRFIHLANEEQRKSYATAAIEHESILKPFLTGDLGTVWLAVWLALGDRAKVEGVMKNRQIASASPTSYPPELRSQFFLLKGKAARFLRQYDKANSFFKSVTFPNLFVEARTEMFEIAKENDKPETMIEIASQIKSHNGSEKQIQALDSIADVIISKKAWHLVGPLQKLAESSNVAKKDMAPIITLNGRAYFEKGNYLKAIDSFETAIAISPELEKKADLKFRLAKSYYKTKQKERARKQWEELVQLKDETWSPLAANELKLLEGK